VRARSARRLSSPAKAAKGAADPKKVHPMTPDHELPDFEPDHAESSTAHALEEMSRYGYRPFVDEPDLRPLPEDHIVSAAVADIFDALVSTLTDTCLDPDLENLLWATVNLFHRAADRVQRQLDDNEDAQKRSQREQDGSEVRSVELERLLAEGRTLIERRDAMEAMRDEAAEHFQRHTHSPWTPRAGSKVNRKALTSAVVDSRDFINARRWADQQVLIPPGERIAFTGGVDFNDHRLIWDVLDKVLAKHPRMVLLHGGYPTGAERIAATWADARTVPQVPFRPKFALHGKKAAPFKRNDEMLQAMPIGVVVFPGGGIQDNLHDKAVAIGIRPWDFRGRGGA
jgi:hypothetical protein